MVEKSETVVVNGYDISTNLINDSLDKYPCKRGDALFTASLQHTMQFEDDDAPYVS